MLLKNSKQLISGTNGEMTELTPVMLEYRERIIPGTNGEMTELDLVLLLEKLEEKNNFDYADLLPICEMAIDTFVMLKEGTKEELIEENRKLYEAKEWEKYI